MFAFLKYFIKFNILNQLILINKNFNWNKYFKITASNINRNSSKYRRDFEQTLVDEEREAGILRFGGTGEMTQDQKWPTEFISTG